MHQALEASQEHLVLPLIELDIVVDSVNPIFLAMRRVTGERRQIIRKQMQKSRVLGVHF